MARGVVTSFSLQPVVLQELRSVADSEGVSVSELIRVLVSEALVARREVRAVAGAPGFVRNREVVPAGGSLERVAWEPESPG